MKPLTNRTADFSPRVDLATHQHCGAEAPRGLKSVVQS